MSSRSVSQARAYLHRYIRALDKNRAGELLVGPYKHLQAGKRRKIKRRRAGELLVGPYRQLQAGAVSVGGKRRRRKAGAVAVGGKNPSWLKKGVKTKNGVKRGYYKGKDGHKHTYEIGNASSRKRAKNKALGK